MPTIDTCSYCFDEHPTCSLHMCETHCRLCHSEIYNHHQINWPSPLTLWVKWLIGNILNTRCQSMLENLGGTLKMRAQKMKLI